MKKGFTLVELIIVIAVLGVLAAIIIAAFPGIFSSADRGSAISDAVNAQKNYIATRDAAIEDEVAIVVEKNEKMYLFGYTFYEQRIKDSGFSIDKPTEGDMLFASLRCIEAAQYEGKVTKRPAFHDVSDEINALPGNVRVFTGCCMKGSEQGTDINIGEGDTWHIEPGEYTLSNNDIADIDSSGDIHARKKGSSYIYSDGTILYTLNVYEYIVWDGADIGFLKAYAENDPDPVFIRYESEIYHYHWGNGEDLPITIPKGKILCCKDDMELSYKAEYIAGTDQSSFEKTLFEVYGELRLINCKTSFDPNPDVGYFIDNTENGIVRLDRCSCVNVYKLPVYMRNSGQMHITGSDINSVLNDTSGEMILTGSEVAQIENRGELTLRECSQLESNNQDFRLTNSGSIDEITDCNFFVDGFDDYTTGIHHACIINSGYISEINNCSFNQTSDMVEIEGSTLDFIENNGTVDSIRNCAFYCTAPEYEQYSFERAVGISIKDGRIGGMERLAFDGAFDADIVLYGGTLGSKLRDGTYTHMVDASLIADGYVCRQKGLGYTIEAR